MSLLVNMPSFCMVFDDVCMFAFNSNCYDPPFIEKYGPTWKVQTQRRLQGQPPVVGTPTSRPTPLPRPPWRSMNFHWSAGKQLSWIEADIISGHSADTMQTKLLEKDQDSKVLAIRQPIHKIIHKAEVQLTIWRKNPDKSTNPNFPIHFTNIYSLGISPSSHWLWKINKWFNIIWNHLSIPNDKSFHHIDPSSICSLRRLLYRATTSPGWECFANSIAFMSLRRYWFLDTPWKINMEPQNEGLEDDFPFQLSDF